MKICERCNRPLKAQKSMDSGMGPVCTKKAAEEEAQAEFERNQVTMDEVLNHAESEKSA